MLTVKNIRVRYGNNVVINNLSLDINDGEIYSLIGPSGCGKSTLLKVLCGILPYEGQILSDRKNVSPLQLQIGYVPQQYGLLDWKTVSENILLPFRLDKGKRRDDTEIKNIVSELEIEDLMSRYPSQLSGGQKQRVALARAFASQPQILLMDEPFSSLDTFTSIASQRLFLRLWDKYKVTTLFITHNIHEAVSIGQHILLMGKSGGEITAQIENPLFNQPEKDEERIRFVSTVLSRAYS